MSVGCTLVECLLFEAHTYGAKSRSTEYLTELRHFVITIAINVSTVRFVPILLSPSSEPRPPQFYHASQSSNTLVLLSIYYYKNHTNSSPFYSYAYLTH